MGYQAQSRWDNGYNADGVREIVKKYHENGIPLDMVYLDINYMKGFKDFTIDTESFPDLAGLSDELKEKGVRLVPIIDAGIKVLEGDPTAGRGDRKGLLLHQSGWNPLHWCRLAGAFLLHRLPKPRGAALVRDALQIPDR